MVATIGIIIGLYVSTRMIELMAAPKERRNALVISCAVITLLVTLLGTFDLFVRGLTTTTPGLP